MMGRDLDSRRVKYIEQVFVEKLLSKKRNLEIRRVLFLNCLYINYYKERIL